jgi:hypothetical protein
MGVLIAKCPVTEKEFSMALMLIKTALLVFGPSWPHRSVRTAVPNTLGEFTMRGTSMRHRPTCLWSPDKAE